MSLMRFPFTHGSEMGCFLARLKYLRIFFEGFSTCARRERPVRVDRRARDSLAGGALPRRRGRRGGAGGEAPGGPMEGVPPGASTRRSPANLSGSPPARQRRRTDRANSIVRPATASASPAGGPEAPMQGQDTSPRAPQAPPPAPPITAPRRRFAAIHRRPSRPRACAVSPPRTCSLVLIVSNGCRMHCVIVLASTEASAWRTENRGSARRTPTVSRRLLPRGRSTCAMRAGVFVPYRRSSR